MKKINNTKVLNKYSKNGMFLVKMPEFENNNLDSKVTSLLLKGWKQFKVNPLSDKDNCENWKLVLPKMLLIKNQDESGNIHVKQTNLFHTFNINMSELPYHLMNKIKFKYENGELSHYEVRDKIYKYRIICSDIDKDIIYLAHMLHNKNYNFDKMLEYVLAMDELNLNGWVLMKAKQILKKYNYS
jgi:hypothetical protein